MVIFVISVAILIGSFYIAYLSGRVNVNFFSKILSVCAAGTMIAGLCGIVTFCPW